MKQVLCVYILYRQLALQYSMQMSMFLRQYAGPVNAENVEEAKLVVHQYLLELILESNRLYSEIKFEDVDVVEVFQDELKEMMKIARKRPK